MIVIGGATRPRRGGRAATAAVILLGLVVATLVTGTGTGPARAATGSWTVTGSMSAAHDDATATLLQNGEVLVAGGQNTNGLLATAELYNPAAGTWTPTGSMTTARSGQFGQTATLLQNGEVLVAGGEDTNGTLLDAEVYNPATGTWAATGPMVTTAGTGATATLLPNGTVLVAGGCCSAGPGYDPSFATAQIYNPATNSWTATASMSTGRAYATATLLGNGTVLVVGGAADDGGIDYYPAGQFSAEIYNPATGLWQGAGTTATGHDYATASLLPSGQVLVAGGSNGALMGGVTGADLYTPSTGTWQAAAPMNIARAFAAAVVLPDGTVLMTGGWNGITPLGIMTSTEIYQPATNTWTPGPDMNQHRENHTATLLQNGQVLVVGGDTVNVGATAELYSAGAGSPPAPVVTGVSPSSGAAAGGTAVTVTGSNLTGGSVSFGGTTATGVSCSASSCTATSPAGSGTVDVTITTPGGTSATGSADQFTYQAAPPSNLIPDPGFESAGVTADYWGSRLARSTAVVHSGSWALAQTIGSSSGGWDLDSDPGWYAPVSSSKTYTAGIWVRPTATVKVNLSLDLLASDGSYVDSATGPNVTLAAGTWTHLTVTGIKPTASEVYGGMEPDFLKGTKRTVIYWDDMSLTSP